MSNGAISTAILAGVILILLILGIRRMVKNCRSGSCCSGSASSSGCAGCGGCPRAEDAPAERK